ncbi:MULTISPECIES: hypothetical protein [unclassified Streptomyces]|uniref:hypothetical protein n=1 Tax=unclassified Streptomyces TaxID=2593676 RepID=UPI00380FB802
MSPRRVRFPPEVDLPTPAPPIPSIGPIVFTLRFDGEDHHFDLSHLPCPRLVRSLAERLRQIGGDDGTKHGPADFQQTVRAVRLFVVFIAAAEPTQAEDFTVGDLEPDLLDAFEDHLSSSFPKGSGAPMALLSDVLRLLRDIHEDDEDALSLEMQGRIGFTATSTERRKSKPLDSYPMPVFERVEEAALADVRAIRDRILRGERLAERGEDPDSGGWGRLENVLWYIVRNGPITSADWWGHRPLRKLGGIRAVNSNLFLNKDDMVPFLALLICQTGLEPECAKTLRANCLVNPARGFVSIAYVKNRAHGNTHKTMRVSDGGALHFPGGLIRLAMRLSQRARVMAGTDAIWTLTMDSGLRAPYRRGGGHTARDAVAWLARHKLDQLPDRGGGPLILDMRRLRKSHKSRNYLRAGGILEDFVSGHSKDVAAAHYADIEAHREVHDQAVENGLQEALDTALAPPIVLDDDGSRLDGGERALELEEVQKALGVDDDVWLASCRDYYDSPWALKKGSACPVAVWGCVECPNAVFTTRHLPSLLSFLDFLEAQREEFSNGEWAARHGLAWERIVRGVLPKFSNEQVTTATAIAEAAGPRLSLPAQLLELTV